ncbi:MAG: DUF5110 domain-containing protein [Bacteroidales bacterium]|nr:DUF5110 domain-containing protein [Bacteroidales bacterium]
MMLKKKLTIGKRTGSFNGMPENRTFSVVVVNSGKATGVEIAPNPDKTISYSGEEIVVQL